VTDDFHSVTSGSSHSRGLKAVLAAVTAYTKAIVADTAYYSPVNVHDETGFLVDAASEIVGAFNNACDRMLGDQEIAAE
jgi:hypothetical protein